MAKEATPTPLFEVIRDKQGLMCTYELSCIYDKTTLDSMAKSGHKFKLNGKVASAAQVTQYVKDNTTSKKKKSK